MTAPRGVLYLDGVANGSEDENAPPANQTNVVTAFGAALIQAGTASGAFAGTLDEVRIWNTARTAAQIQAAMGTQIAVPTAGLVARYGMNETSGTNVSDTSGNNIVGTAVNGPSWVAGAPFGDQGAAPGQPTLVAPVDGASGSRSHLTSK